MEAVSAPTQLRTQFIAGVLFALLYDLSTAAKGVYVGHLTQGIHPMLLTFVCFLLTAVVFNSFQLGLYRQGKIIRQWKDVLLSNIVTVGAWIGYFYALKYLEPAVTGSIVMGSGPVITTLLLRNRKGANDKLVPGENLAAIGVLASIACLAFFSVNGKTAVKTSTPLEQWIGLIAATIGGISAAGNTIASKRLSRNGFSPNEIIATRFFLLILVTGAFVLGEKPAMQPVYSQLGGILVSIAFGLILPITCIQMAIARLEPMAVAFLCALLPVFMLPIQVFDHRLEFSAFSAAGVILAVGFVCMGTFTRYRSLS